MKLMCPAIQRSSVFLPFVLIFVLAATGVFGQTRKTTTAKKPDAKKSTKTTKDARKDGKKEKAATNAKNSKKPSSREKNSAKTKDSRKDQRAANTKNSKQSKSRDTKQTKASSKRNKREAKPEKLTAAEKRRLDALAKKDPKKARVEQRRLELARRKAEEERRRAIIAEQRRREEAARQARLRQIAFENGLKEETRVNIARDNVEGEDLQIRSAALSALGNKAGTVVVMEAQTGKIVTMVNQDWAIRNSFKPCSTIKLVTGAAGVTEKVINEEGRIGQSSEGMSLDWAIARSHNGYFQRVGSNIGSTRMVEYARELGLGEPTGLNADGESAGRVPNGNNNVRIYSHGDDFEVTPLQLAVMTSAISNNGKRVVPQVARTRTEDANFRPKFRRPSNVPQSGLEELLPGMIGASEYGTAARGVDASLGIAGKTGSCIHRGTWIGLFASVAPVENPKYSVVVITRGSGERGKYAAAIAGRIYQALATRVRPARNLELAAARFGHRPSVDKAIAAEDEDEDDAEAANIASVENSSETPSSDIRVVPAVKQPAVKPLVTKTGKSTPKFPPVVITYQKDTPPADKPAVESERPRVVKPN